MKQQKSAVERLNNGEKPIILVDNTSDNIMAELQAEQIANGENNGRPLDIKDIMLYEFNKLITKKVTHQETNEETGEVTTYVTRELIHGENEEIIAEIEHIKNPNRELPDMAGSPLDAVQKGIRDAGFTIDEITGRKLKFDYEEGEVVKRKPADKGNQYNRFNNGDLQALIINRSGATGYSAQDAEKFKNRGRRALIELESPNSIVDLMQAYGRVNRMGQLTTPEVEFIETGNPVSMYIVAIREAHLSHCQQTHQPTEKAMHHSKGHWIYLDLLVTSLTDISKSTQSF